MKYTLPKKMVVKQNSDFQKIYRNGRSLANRNLVVYFCKAFHPSYRVAFAAGKKLGNAVTRNRVKRLLREAYRLHRHEIDENYCLLLVGRAAAVDISSTEMEKSFYSLCQRANVLRKEDEQK
ncbi:MAG TPA: ribonuclease P protein component [Megamonas hypermegale]|jgi:ribonuclease P protein component|nr:ribonuclease P protein component [Megamonas hypermegale]MBM6761170.1 ribonuclease P protein component [Megamonas hypermegale]MBM6833332.1 ribonuclease P protein component [Megamonas hypermegale]HJG07143.1 ribonuclease P protein component [Megamonas hypermegale]